MTDRCLSCTNHYAETLSFNLCYKYINLLLLYFSKSFYSSSCLLSAVIAMIVSPRLSVRPSVCLSHYPVINPTNEDYAVSQNGSLKTLVFGEVKMLRKFKGYHPERNNFQQVPNSETWKTYFCCYRVTSPIINLLVALGLSIPVSSLRLFPILLHLICDQYASDKNIVTVT